MREDFLVAGRKFQIQTESKALLGAARASLPGWNAAPGGAPEFRFVLSVNEEGPDPPPLDAPIFRGRDYLVYAAFGEHSALVFDLRTRTAVGSVSADLAANTAYWQRVIFPVALGIVCPVIDVVPLHCASVVVNGKALLIAGESGAGKSTLAAVMARNGFGYLSDDWTFLSTQDERASVHALPANLKLLPDAVQFFPELEKYETALSQNGERAYEVDPESALGCRRVYACDPQWVVLLERREDKRKLIARAPIEHVVAMFASALDTIPACLSHKRRQQLDLIRRLESCECWHLRCGGSPEEIASHLLDLCAARSAADALPPALPRRLRPLTEPDLMRRLVPAPYAFRTSLDGIALDVQTNSASLRRAYPRPAGKALRSQAGFSCTVIAEPPQTRLGTSHHAFRNAALACVSLGRDGFVAFNFAARSILAFVTPEFAHAPEFARLLKSQLTAATLLQTAETPVAHVAAD